MKEGLEKSTSEGRVFLQVAYGKLRQKTLENGQKVSSETPGAVMRKTQSGESSYALEHNSVTGIIENIYFKTNNKYKDSYEVIMRVVADTYQVSFRDETPFWGSFMERLPNIDLSKVVKIGVYDFQSDNDKRRSGTYIEQEDNPKAEARESKNGIRYVIPSAYVKKVQGNIKFLYNYPPSTGVKWDDKNDRKKYFIDLYSFLNEQFKKFSENAKFTEPTSNTGNEAPFPVSEDDVEGETDMMGDLPF